MPSKQDDGWADVGRSLLAYKFQMLGEELHNEFTKASRKAESNEQITGGDVERLYETMERARSMVDEFAKVPDDYQRPKRASEIIPPRELQEIIERAKEGEFDE
ncbi:hypothetical protein [Halostella litorea]|uniref:hypothetical protein n=1 Tax=Halostella litorea TaxID=2528831 RepID=UPI0010931D63|nr:hypothetical protein [Halostella litorea]